MIQKHNSILTGVCLAAILTASQGSEAKADPLKWPGGAEARIKAIYERGEFRGRSFNADWLPDSSGYVVREEGSDAQPARTVRYDVQTGEATELTGDDSISSHPNPRLSPDGNFIAEGGRESLSIRNVDTGETTPLILRLLKQDVFIRDPVWSPDGKQLLFVESNETKLRKRSVLLPTDPTYPEVEEHRFARVGGDIAKLRVGVIDVETKQVTWLPFASDEEDLYLGQVEWAGNSSEVLIEKLSRFRDVREFLLVNIDTQDVKQIYREQNEAWAISSQGKNLGLIWVEEGTSFLVISEQDGWRHARRYSRDGEKLCLLTQGDYDIIDRAAVDEAGGWFYFYASPDNGTQSYLHRVPLDGSGTLERVSPENQPGTHEYVFSPDAKWAFHTYSTIDTPPVIDLVEVAGHRVVRVLEENAELVARAKNVISHPTEFLQLDIGDGVAMDALLMRPREFDASKKYPVFVYVYGEPHGQTVLDKWGAGQVDFHRVIADLGYVVVSIDNRGTPAPKGAAWRRAIFGSLGPLSTEDQAAGLKELARQRPFVDLSRVAIWGWSGGGSNTLNAMFRKPGVYHVGIAIVPKPQPHLYNAWFQEIYMRTREVNAEGYERSAPLNFADGLQGKLLMVTGSGETNTHMQIIEGLVDRLIELGKPFDYMVYPNRNHGLREGPGSLVHVRMLIARYLVENLPRGPQ
ncbi:MAG: S9 family peptidase [Planctomycetaceae bacterium]|nr:S9 family peptidase [Planctomycetaceae bacterium]